MKLCYLVLGCPALTAPATAQEKEDGKAVRIEYIKFKPNTEARVDEIEAKYFDPAARKMGFSPMVVRFKTGPWDRLYVFPLVEGMAALDYKSTKTGAGWMAEVDRLAGGPGSAKKLLAEFGNDIERSSTDLGFMGQR